MKAVILAAGRGTRVQPITCTMPKPMLPILNKPVMEILVDLLVRHNFRQIMVNTSYLAPAIETYFRDGSRFGAEIGYSFEGRMDDGRIIDEALGSAGALRKIQDHSGFFNETFIVLCGDALIDLDLTELYRLHRQKGALATIVLTRVPRPEVPSYGVVVTDENGRILEFQEKPSAAQAKSTMVNTGIYVFEPEILELIPEEFPHDIGRQLFPQLVVRQLPFFGVQLPFRWLDIGAVADYYEVLQSALLGCINGVKVPGTEISDGIWLGLNVRIHPTQCRLVPPLCIGSSSTVEPGCTLIGPCLVGQGCVVESGAHVERSIIFEHTRIGALANVRSMMVSGRFCVDSSGQAIDLSTSDIDWVLSDARVPKKALTEDQLAFFDVLTNV